MLKNSDIKNNQGRWTLIKDLFKGNLAYYIGALVAVALAVVFSFSGPLVLRYTIDTVLGGKDPQVPSWLKSYAIVNKGTVLANLWLPGLAMVLVASLGGVFMYLKGRWAAIASENLAQTLRNRLYNHLQHLPYTWHANAKTGDLVQRCTSDVDTFRRFLSVQVVEIGRSVFMIAFASYVMFKLDTRMSLISLAAIPVFIVGSYLFFVKARAAFLRSDEADGALSATLQENLTGVRVVRAFARQQHEIEKFDKDNSNYRNLSYRLIHLLAWYWGCSDGIALTMIITVLAVGANFAIKGSLSIGTLVVFITYEGMLLWPVRELGRILADMGKAQVSLKRIKEILDAEPEDLEQGTALEQVNGQIEFNNVCYTYPGTEQQVLSDISFTVKPGQMVAILGRTGSGKTTLVSLLPRLMDYTSGSITVDGVELKQLSKGNIRKNIGMVLQEPFLYSKTLEQNIALAHPDTCPTEITQAATIACVHDSITGFEHGYKTAVGERGVTLSGGQKQRVAIARALIGNKPILIFDDSLSAVDTATDAAIRKRLLNRQNRATTFIIAHRISTLSQADFIIVLENGRIVQQGTHDQLLQQPGLYADIAGIQTKLEEEYAAADALPDKAPSEQELTDDTDGHIRKRIG